jgi:peptidoglycan/LPS O-acetylase OafA/YrhL
MARARVSEIDLLRFLAALAVVFFHYAFKGYAAGDLAVAPSPELAPYAKYGYLGVQLFFVISGFVIMLTAANRGVKEFAVARFVRLYPAFWACCTVTFLVIVAFGGRYYPASVQQYLANMTMLSELFGVRSISGVYWSLFVEMRFYFLVALVIALRQIHHLQAILVCWLCATVAVLICPSSTISYFLNTNHSPYFVAGATFYLIWSDRITLARVLLLTVSWLLAMYLTVRDSVRIGAELHTTLDPRIVIAIVTAIFLIMIIVTSHRSFSVPKAACMVLGAITYPLYLLHETIGFIILNAFTPTVNVHLLFWATTGIMIVAAYGVHALIEKPLAPIVDRALNGILRRFPTIATKRVT